MELFEAIKGRRSIRAFAEKPVADELIERILDAGRFAPSGLNNQPWRFIINKDPKTIKKLSEQTIYPETLLQARATISVFLDSDSSYDKEKDTLAIGACIQNMLLAAHASGLGACWLGEILKNREKVNSILSAPKTYRLTAVLALGYPRGQAEEAERKGLEELIYKNGPET